MKEEKCNFCSRPATVIYPVGIPVVDEDLKETGRELRPIACELHAMSELGMWFVENGEEKKTTTSP